MASVEKKRFLSFEVFDKCSQADGDTVVLTSDYRDEVTGVPVREGDTVEIVAVASRGGKVMARLSCSLVVRDTDGTFDGVIVSVQAVDVEMNDRNKDKLARLEERLEGPEPGVLWEASLHD